MSAGFFYDKQTGNLLKTFTIPDPQDMVIEHLAGDHFIVVSQNNIFLYQLNQSGAFKSRLIMTGGRISHAVTTMKSPLNDGQLIVTAENFIFFGANFVGVVFRDFNGVNVKNALLGTTTTLNAIGLTFNGQYLILATEAGANYNITFYEVRTDLGAPFSFGFVKQFTVTLSNNPIGDMCFDGQNLIILSGTNRIDFFDISESGLTKIKTHIITGFGGSGICTDGQHLITAQGLP